MSKKNEQSLIRNGLASLNKGDVAGLKKSVQEALFSKVRRALNKKEKEIAKDLIESTSLREK